MYKMKSSKYQEIRKNKITDNYKIDYNNTIDHGGARGVMVIVVGNGHGNTSSNPGPD